MSINFIPLTFQPEELLVLNPEPDSSPPASMSSVWDICWPLWPGGWSGYSSTPALWPQAGLHSLELMLDDWRKGQLQLTVSNSKGTRGKSSAGCETGISPWKRRLILKSETGIVVLVTRVSLKSQFVSWYSLELPRTVDTSGTNNKFESFQYKIGEWPGIWNDGSFLMGKLSQFCPIVRGRGIGWFSQVLNLGCSLAGWVCWPLH